VPTVRWYLLRYTKVSSFVAPGKRDVTLLRPCARNRWQSQWQLRRRVAREQEVLRGRSLSLEAHPGFRGAGGGCDHRTHSQ